jgi:hypothetical protein
MKKIRASKLKKGMVVLGVEGTIMQYKKYKKGGYWFKYLYGYNPYAMIGKFIGFAVDHEFRLVK